MTESVPPTIEDNPKADELAEKYVWYINDIKDEMPIPPP
jgi:hypothetical protein